MWQHSWNRPCKLALWQFYEPDKPKRGKNLTARPCDQFLAHCTTISAVIKASSKSVKTHKLKQNILYLLRSHTHTHSGREWRNKMLRCKWNENAVSIHLTVAVRPTECRPCMRWQMCACTLCIERSRCIHCNCIAIGGSYKRQTKNMRNEARAWWEHKMCQVCAGLQHCMMCEPFRLPLYAPVLLHPSLGLSCYVFCLRAWVSVCVCACGWTGPLQ